MQDPELGVGVKLEKKDKNKKEFRSPREKKEKTDKKEKKEKKEKETKSKGEKQDKAGDARSSSPQKSRNLARVLSFSSHQKKEKDTAERAATEKAMKRSKSEVRKL